MVDYEKLIDFVKAKQSGHPFAGFDHIERVHAISMDLAKGHAVDMDVLRVAAYLHDIAVPVLGAQMHHERAAEVVGDLLNQVGLAAEKQKFVFDIIRTHTRYSKTEPVTLEAKILKDADGIDYLGAVGIMRGVLRGFQNKVYSGNVNSQGKQVLDELIKNVEGTFATEKGLQMANERIEFIKMFRKRLAEELNV